MRDWSLNAIKCQCHNIPVLQLFPLTENTKKTMKKQCNLIGKVLPPSKYQGDTRGSYSLQRAQAEEFCCLWSVDSLWVIWQHQHSQMEREARGCQHFSFPGLAADVEPSRDLHNRITEKAELKETHKEGRQVMGEVMERQH